MTSLSTQYAVSDALKIGDIKEEVPDRYWPTPLRRKLVEKDRKQGRPKQHGLIQCGAQKSLRQFRIKVTGNKQRVVAVSVGWMHVKVINYHSIFLFQFNTELQALTKIKVDQLYLCC